MADTAVRRVLIYRLGSLGDMLIALPALHLVQRAFPRAERRLLTNVPVHAKAPAAAAVLTGTGLVDGYLRYVAGTRRVLDLLRLWWQIVRFRPHLVVYLAAARGVAAAKRDQRFFRWCGVRRSIGVPLTEAMQSNFFGAAPESARARHLLQAAMLEPEAARLARNLAELGSARLQDGQSWSLHLSSDERRRASEAIDEACQRAGHGQGSGEQDPRGNILAVSVGTKVQAKDWGRENWQQLLTQLARRVPGATLLLLGAPEESQTSDFAAAGWAANGGGPVVNLCGRLSPRESAAAISLARVFLGHDSGPMHLAAAVGTPCVAVFAARNIPRQWFPFGDRHEVLYHRVDCWGCGLETCLEQRRRCLAGISVEEVLAAANRVLNPQAAPLPSGPRELVSLNAALR